MGKNNRYQYLTETKTRKKLYKSKKLWLVAGITGLTAFAGGAYQMSQPNVSVHADTISSQTSAQAVYANASVPSQSPAQTSTTPSDNDVNDVYKNADPQVSSAPSAAPISATTETTSPASSATSSSAPSSQIETNSQTNSVTPTPSVSQISSVNTQTSTPDNNLATNGPTYRDNDSSLSSINRNTTNVESPVTSSNDTNNSPITGSINVTSNSSANLTEPNAPQLSEFNSNNNNVTSNNAKSFATPNAKITNINNDNSASLLNENNTVNTNSNLTSGANYALSNSNKSNETSAEIDALYNQNNNPSTGANGNGNENNNNSNNVNTPDSSTNDTDLNQEAAAAVYNEKTLDLAIQKANANVANVLNRTNNNVDVQYRDVDKDATNAAALAYRGQFSDTTLTTTQPTPSTITNVTNGTVTIPGADSQNNNTTIGKDAAGLNLIHVVSSYTLQKSNGNSPYDITSLPTQFEVAFQNDTNGRSLVQAPLDGTSNGTNGGIQNLVVTIKDGNGNVVNTIGLSNSDLFAKYQSDGPSIPGSPNKLWYQGQYKYISTDTSNDNAKLGLLTTSTSDYVNKSQNELSQSGSINNNAFKNNPALGNTVSYEDINVGQILADKGGQTSYSNNGDTIQLDFDQGYNGLYTPTSESDGYLNNGGGVTYTEKPISEGLITTSKERNTTPILVHYLAMDGHEIQAPTYITAPTIDEYNKGDQINATIPSPANWNYNHAFQGYNLSTGQYAYPNDKPEDLYYDDNNQGITNYYDDNDNLQNVNQTLITSSSPSSVNLQSTLLSFPSYYQNQHDNVYLYYNQVQPIAVNPSNPETPGSPTDPDNPNGPKYPNDVSDLSQQVTETIHYVDGTTGQQLTDSSGNLIPDSTQTVNYGRTLVIEKYSGNILGWSSNDTTNADIPYANGDSAWHVWSPSTSSTTNPVTSPDMSSEGYDAPSQATMTVNGTTTEIDGQASVVSSQTLNRNSPISITVKYYPGKGIFTPDQAGQHGQVESNFEKSITQTINYIDNKTQLPISNVSPNVQTVTFTRDGVYDKVHGTFLGYTSSASPDSNNPDASGDNTPWTSTNDLYNSVTSPDLSSRGYKPGNPSSIGSSVPQLTDGDTVKNVYYDHDIGTFIPSDAANHGQNENNFERNVTRTINYLDATNQQALATPNTQTVQLTRDGVYDKVDNTFLGYTSAITPDPSHPQQGDNAAWTASGSYSQVISPDESIKGYNAPDKQVVPNETPNGNSTNEVINVLYTHGIKDSTRSKQDIRTIEYQDADDGSMVAPTVTQPITLTQTTHVDKVTGQIIGTDPWTSDNNHWNAVNSPDLSAKGYDTANPIVVNAVNDNDVNGNPIIIVKYPHKLLPSQVETQQVKRTIHYIDETNGNTVAPDATEHVDFKRVGVIDQVLKDRGESGLVGYSSKGDNNPDIAVKDADKAWIPTTQTFAAITSPDLSAKGYTAPSDGGEAEVAHPGEANVNETVKYGHQSAFVGPDNGYTAGNAINPNDPNSAKWPSDIAKSNLQRDIVRTIHYIDQDTGKPVSEDVVQDVTYKRMAVIDKVTGKLEGWSLNNTRKVDLAADDGDNAWTTDDDQWAKAISPDLTGRGYNPQTENALEQSVKVDDKDVTITIPYTHAIGAAEDEMRTIIRTIHYRDGDTGATVSPDVIEKVQYFRTAMKDKVTGQIKGYSLNHDGKIDVSVNDGDKAWQSNDNKWEGIDSPILNGYQRPDVYRVHHVNVAPDQKDVTTEVKYYKKHTHSCPPAQSSSAATPNKSNSATSGSSSASAPASHSNTPSSSSSVSLQPAPQIPSDTPTNVPSNSDTAPSSSSATPNNSSSSNDTVNLSDMPDDTDVATDDNDTTPISLSDAPTDNSSSANEPTAVNYSNASNSQSPIQTVPAQSYVTQSYAASSAQPATQIDSVAASNAEEPNEVTSASSNDATLPQTGESNSALLESELIGLFMLAFAELLRKMPHLMDKRKKKANK